MPSRKNICILLLLLPFLNIRAQEVLTYTFDASAETVPYHPYWKATGYTPASMTTESDFRLYLNMMKALRGDAIEYVRPHFLLNHVTINSPGTEQQSYEWSELDEILDILVEADLKLIFEIMMSPHDYFNDWYDRKKLIAWKDFCKALVLHLEERYGKEEIQQWYFESINEPDIGYWWPYGPLQFLYYYDATSQGILEGDPELRFGGPGAAFGRSTVYEIFVDHLNNGVNFFTGDRNVRCDFITWHRKDTPHKMMKAEKEVHDLISAYKNEKMSEIPIGNDEADPIAGWNKPFWWRPDPWYASFIAQSVDLHNNYFIDEKGTDYFVLSNDNAFMGDWFRRTQVAQFSNKSEENRDGGFYLIKKPVMTAMALLGMQGSERLRPMKQVSDSTAGLIVSRNGAGEYILLAYNKPELDVNYNKQGTEPDVEDQKALVRYSRRINAELNNISDGKYTLIRYRLDDKNGNPYNIWKENGSEPVPSSELVRELQSHENPVLISMENKSVTSGLTIDSEFESSGIELFYLARKPSSKPESVVELEAQSYKGFNDETMVMLNWEHNDEMHIKTFEVYYAAAGSKKFSKLNSFDVMDNGFLHVGASSNSGKYKVKVVDYWGRSSGFSKTIKVESNS